MIKNKTVKDNFNNILKDDKEFKEVFVLLGVLNKIIIPSSIRIIESKLTALGYSKSLVSRAKFITIELLENMLKHQTSAHTVEPYFELSICGDEMKFVAGNSVSETKSDYLRTKLNRYERLTHDEINNKYIEKLKKGKLDAKGNAGLGILSILKRSNKNYEYKVEKVQNKKEYYFNSTIRLTNLTK